MTDPCFHPPLSADDPRLSEWLDGRLPEAEAVQIARIVAASPELTRMVADLRQQKAALAALPASPPPARFVADVIAALDAAGDTADDDAEVEAEWRRIERERLEEEIAEARDDAAEPVDEPMRHRWPWLALAGALAAGVLAAVVINRPGGMADREVAIVAPQQREERDMKRAAAEALQGDKAAEQDTWLPEVAATGEAGPEALAAKARLAPSAAAAAPAAAQAQGAGIGGGGGGKEPHVRSVTYRIRTAADRQRLESLLAASGRATRDRSNRTLLEKSTGDARMRREAATDKAAEAVEAAGAEMRRGVPGGPPSERIALSGPADMMARLATALEAAAATEFEAEESLAQAEAQADADQAVDSLPAESAAPPAADAQTEITLVIMVVDKSGAAVQADEGQP